MAYPVSAEKDPVPRAQKRQYAPFMTTPEAEHPPTVRMFPDYVGTVLWFDGPVRYEDSGLTQKLISALRSWEESYYHSMTHDLEWVSTEAARRFTVEGNRLAEWLADELGHRYEIAFQSYEGDVPLRAFRSSAPARNANAVAAFDVITVALQTEVADGDRARTALLREKEPGWYARAPLSGSIFKPEGG